MPLLSLSFLGGFTIEAGGLPLRDFDSDKARAILAYLAVEAARPHRRERLAGLFWPESSERHALHSLSQALSSLKKALPGNSSLEIAPQEVRFHLEDCRLDVGEFEALLRNSEQHGHPQEWPCRACQESLEAANALYRGDFLEGFVLDGCAEFEHWMLEQREALRHKQIQVLGRLSLGCEAAGDLENALATASRLVALDALNEAAHRRVMRLLARQERRLEALAQFSTCQKVLSDELGIEPEPETAALYQQILAGRETTFSPPVRHNLPGIVNSLLGRQVELENLSRRLADPACRLVTVLGGGGIGKSRLALEAGHALLPAFRDGVFLVELEAQSPQASLALCIARALGIQVHAVGAAYDHPGGLGRLEVQDQLLATLEDKHLLLILDGFEGLLNEVSLVNRLLRRLPQLKILVTSRVRLNLDAEHIFFLEGLSFPGAGQSPGQAVSLPPVTPGRFDLDQLLRYGAVQLFTDVARRSDPAFSLTEANQQEVTEICSLAQGIPLGILLAAAWIGTLQPAQILQELRRNLDILSSAWHDLPDRQRSLRATFDYSLALLPEKEKDLFLRLAVFRAPFTAQRAEQVVGASLYDLRSLVHQSLLMHASPNRYHMHDLLHQYALEKLSTLPADYTLTRERHCQVYLSALAGWAPRLKNRELPAALAEIDQEYADILAAWEWAISRGDITRLENTRDSLTYYHFRRGRFTEIERICQESLGRLEARGVDAQSARLWLRLATARARTLLFLNNHQDAAQVIQYIDQKIQAWGELAAGMLRELAMLSFCKGEFIMSSGGNRLKALESFRLGLELMYAGEDPADISYALWKNAFCHGQCGNIRETRQMAEQALAHQQDLGDPVLLSDIYEELGWSQMLSGDYQAGIETVHKLDTLRSNIDRHRFQGMSDTVLGTAVFYSGEYAQARSLLERAIPECILPVQGEYREFAQYILAAISLQMGDYAGVLADASYSGEVISEYNRKGLSLFKGQVYLLSSSWEQAEQELNIYQIGVRSLPRLDMVGQPLALLGYIAYRRGRLEEAHQYLKEALENGVKQGFFWVFMLALSVLAYILAEAGELEQALELYATATAHPCAGNSTWWEDIFGKRINELTAALPPETITAAQRRGRGRDLVTTGQEYLDWLGASPYPLGGFFNKQAESENG